MPPTSISNLMRRGHGPLERPRKSSVDLSPRSWHGMLSSCPPGGRLARRALQRPSRAPRPSDPPQPEHWRSSASVLCPRRPPGLQPPNPRRAGRRSRPRRPQLSPTRPHPARRRLQPIPRRSQPRRCPPIRQRRLQPPPQPQPSSLLSSHHHPRPRRLRRIRRLRRRVRPRPSRRLRYPVCKSACLPAPPLRFRST